MQTGLSWLPASAGVHSTPKQRFSLNEIEVGCDRIESSSKEIEFFPGAKVQYMINEKNIF